MPLPLMLGEPVTALTNRVWHKWRCVTSEAKSWSTVFTVIFSLRALSSHVRSPDLEAPVLERPHVDALVNSPSWAQPLKNHFCQGIRHMSRSILDPPAHLLAAHHRMIAVNTTWKRRITTINHKKWLLGCFFFLAAPCGMQDLSSLNLCPLQWKCRVLTTGLPGKSKKWLLF